MNNLRANWLAPPNVFALTTTKLGGRSHGAFASNNLGLHVGDNACDVEANRVALMQQLNLPNNPIWLEQTHTNHCVLVHDETVERLADAAVTRHSAYPLAIMTADCLPIVLTNHEGTEIAAIHAGWRGLANGIIENTLATMQSAPDTCIAWIGPAICMACYETGDEVFDAFNRRYSFAHSAFKKQNSRFHANLAKLAELILQSTGVQDVSQSNACTYELKNEFYSYRRAAQTGRMATLIWFQDK